MKLQYNFFFAKMFDDRYLIAEIFSRNPNEFNSKSVWAFHLLKNLHRRTDAKHVAEQYGIERE